MDFPKTVLIYFISVFSLSYTASSAKFAECKICQSRDFLIEVSEDCYCPEKTFCNETTGLCNKCDEHFDFWNDIIRKIKNNIETSLDTFIENYEIDLKDLQRKMLALAETSKKQEIQLENLSNLSDKINKDISSTLNKFTKIQDDLHNMRGKLKSISIPRTFEEVLKHLENFVIKISDILSMMQKIKADDIIDWNKILSFKGKLSEINNYIENVTQKFPEIFSDYLNLPSETESDLSILELILSQNYSFSENQLANNIGDKINWIELDLINLIDTITQFPHNSTVNYQELINNTLRVRTSANATRSRLQTLLQEQENFRQLLSLLKKEKTYYYTIRRLTDRLNAVSESIMDIMDLKAFFELWNNTKTLDHELNVYEKDLQTFKNKVRKIKGYESQMNELQNEQSELLKILEKMESIRSIGEIKNEIKQMLDEVKVITNEINSHCDSNKMQNKTNTEQHVK